MTAKPRLRFVQGLFFLLFLLVAYRSAQVQLFPAKRLKQGQVEHYTTEILKVAARGNIFDRQRRPLALTVDSYSVFAHPYQVKARVKTAHVLSPLLQIPTAELIKDFKSDKPFVWLKRKIDPNVKEKIEQKKLVGIHFLKEAKRIYPNRSLAAHVLGFVNVDMKGLSGLELKFDQALEGTPKKVNVHKDAMGRIIYIGESAASRSRAGYHLVLTLDNTIQFAVEEELENIVDQFSARSAMAIAMNPQTGEILASAIYPTFDPQDPSKVAVGQQRNQLTTDVFEPGSVLKPFTMAAALAAKTARLKKVYDCEGGKIKVGKHVITEASMSHVYDKLVFADILKYSSNVCSVKVAFELGAQRLHGFLERMGFGQVTGIDLPGELPGILHPWKKWSKIHLATVSYGHGIAVTAIQMARAYSAMANGGYLVQPYLVARIEDEVGQLIFDNTALPRVRVFEEDLALHMRKLLIRVTQDGGTGVLARPFGLSIPGKTGTARKYDEAVGGYKKGAYISSFVGMFPPEYPRVVLLVMVDEPQKRSYGGFVAAPGFRNISEKIISLLSLHPYMGQEVLAETKKTKAVSETASPGLPKRKPAAAATQVPKLTGLTLAQVREVLTSQGMAFEYAGVGKVISQHPEPGMAWKDGNVIQVVLKP